MKRLSFRRRSNKSLREDILKHLLNAEADRTSLDVPALAGSLGGDAVPVQLTLEELVADGQVERVGQNFFLTSSGREIALNVLRAHRLWERFLADETGFELYEWHPRAEIAEHRISPEQAESLSGILGNPAYDPHGDPIPTASGVLPLPRGRPLSELSPGTGGRVVHLEDEPEEVYRRLLELGLVVGSDVFLKESTHDRTLLWIDGGVIALKPGEGRNIVIRPDPEWKFSDHIPGERLSELEPGEAGVVLELSPSLRGQERRRLMDMGLIPGTRITAEFDSPSGDPTAYRVRGAFLALRKDQADQIHIQRAQEKLE
jgi:DtxR family Mn-dependent transcriptional regulator